MRPTAVIVGLEENGLGVSRALARRGIACIGIGTPKWEPAYATRTCTIARCPQWSSEALVETLLRVGAGLPGRAPLLITKDEPVTWISERRDELARYYDINLPDPGVVELLMSKIRFLDTAERAGWPVPRTVTYVGDGDLRDHVSGLTFPCILKPAVKNSVFRKSAPRKAYRAATVDELLTAYELIAGWEKEAVIQEWIDGGDERIAYCLAYYDRNGVPLALYAGCKLRQYPTGYGNTAIAAPAPAQWREPLLTLTKRIFDHVGFRGLGSIEYKVRPDGSLVIMEPTVGRTNWQSEIAVLNGVDIPAIAYYDLAGLDGAPAAREGPVCKLVDGRADFAELRALGRGSPLSPSRWLADRRGRKRYLLWRASDPAPTIAWHAYVLYRAVRYAVRRVPLKVLRRLRLLASRPRARDPVDRGR